MISLVKRAIGHPRCFLRGGGGAKFEDVMVIRFDSVYMERVCMLTSESEFSSSTSMLT